MSQWPTHGVLGFIMITSRPHIELQATLKGQSVPKCISGAELHLLTGIVSLSLSNDILLFPILTSPAWFCREWYSGWVSLCQGRIPLNLKPGCMTACSAPRRQVARRRSPMSRKKHKLLQKKVKSDICVDLSTLMCALFHLEQHGSSCKL